MNIQTIVSRLLLLGALALGAAGCYTTRVHTGMAGTAPSPMYTDRWHHTVVMGVAEIADPIDLDAACPGGWATIDEKFSFVNLLVHMVTGSIYTPMTYTVVCSGAGPAPAPGASWGAPPPGAPTAPPPQ